MKAFLKQYGMFFAAGAVLVAIMAGMFLVERPEHEKDVERSEEPFLPAASPEEAETEKVSESAPEAVVEPVPEEDADKTVSEPAAQITTSDTKEPKSEEKQEPALPAEQPEPLQKESDTPLVSEQSPVVSSPTEPEVPVSDTPTTPAPEPSAGTPGTTPSAEPEPESTPEAAPASDSAPGTPEPEMCITLVVRCDTLLTSATLDADKAELVPENGILFEKENVVFQENESVFDVLAREMRVHKIPMEYVSSPLYGTAYIEGIGNLYEFDAGELSGWMYRVNGEFPHYGCSKYTLKSGDTVEWLYTCDLGRDVGAEDGDLEAQRND